MAASEVPTRYHKTYGDGYDGGYRTFHSDGYEHHHQGGHRAGAYRGEPDAVSYRSYRGRRRKRGYSDCCLCMLLTFGALLISIGVGVMVYYLLRQDQGSQKYLTTLANNTLPLLNVPYNSDMAQKDSESFKEVADPFCQAVDGYFQNSYRANSYAGCEVLALTSDDSPLPCSECADIIQPVQPDNARVHFKIQFKGDIVDAGGDVGIIIDDKADKIEGQDFSAVLVDEFLVDVKGNTGARTTVGPPPEVGLIGNLTIWVYNLTDDVAIRVPGSDAFDALASPFCYDLQTILLDSSLEGRYHSCHVRKFSEDPDLVVTHIWFRGSDRDDVAANIAAIINDGARDVLVDGKSRKIIGTLLITPEGDGNTTIIIDPYPINPETTTEITPTPATNWTEGMPYLDIYAPFTGHDYMPELSDPDSDVFQYIADRFCNHLDDMIQGSQWKDDYFGCTFRTVFPPHNDYPRARMTLKINDNIQDPDDVFDIIRDVAERFVFPEDLETFQVGDLYLILGDSTASKKSDTFSSLFPTTTLTTSYPTVMTSTMVLTPTMSPASSMATVVVVYNMSTSYIKTELVDFTMTDELNDPTSEEFLDLQTEFCNDMNDYFDDSSLSDVYMECKITSFSVDGDDKEWIDFLLNFDTPKADHLEVAVPAIIVHHAPKDDIGDYIVLNIGDLHLRYRDIDFEVSVSGHTLTPTLSPSTTISMTSTPIGIVLHSATLVNIVSRVLNDLGSPPANAQTRQAKFCEELAEFYRVAYDFVDCYITSYSGGDYVNFHAVFGDEMIPGFDDDVVDVIEDASRNLGFLRIGDLVLAVDSINSTQHAVNYTTDQSVFSTITQVEPSVHPEYDIRHCWRSPCENGATCIELANGYRCVCATGWTGENCDEDIDECDRPGPSLCLYGGVCTNTDGDYECDYQPGRTGKHCETGIDECALDEPCGNGGTCINTDLSYECVCESGWQGTNCTEDVDECATPNTCKHGGECRNRPGDFLCICTPQWTGPTCQDNKNECLSSPCQHGSTCIDSSGGSTCICPTQWQGDVCETDVNECLNPSQCNDRGTCDNYDGGFTCNCDEGWAGDTCEDDINECNLTPPVCENNGRCINTEGSFVCDCTAQWTGNICNIDVDECAAADSPCRNGGTCDNTEDVDECAEDDPCQNDGVCLSSLGSYSCQCLFGWTGHDCDEDVNECETYPDICHNGGTCVNEVGDYRCECPEDHAGKNCDDNTDPCDRLSCLHGGICTVNATLEAICVCPPNWTGDRCQRDLDECDPQPGPCQNVGTCNNLQSSYYCDCVEGFQGENCEDDIDECETDPCQPNGQCLNTFGSYECRCNNGWTGTHCEDDVQECDLLESPCSGNGTCEDLPGTYRCHCYVGWHGQYCQYDDDECAENICDNGSTRINFNGGFSCECPSTFTGDLCDEDVNECDIPETCMNGGTCTNYYGLHTCDCAEGYMGDRCRFNTSNTDTPNFQTIK